MEKQNNAVCSICNKAYRLCPSCDGLSFKSWRTVTDSLNCYKIYLALSEYQDNKDVLAAKKNLEQCDLTELNSFDPDIKAVIKEILYKVSQEKNKSK